MKNSNNPNSRQALSLIGLNKTSDTFEIPSVFKPENQSTQSKNTTIQISNPNERINKPNIQQTALEQTLKNALKEAIEENELV